MENMRSMSCEVGFDKAYKVQGIWVVLRKGVPRGVTMFESVLLICCQ